MCSHNVVLIGSKKDLEIDEAHLQRMKQNKMTVITKEEGEELAKKIGALAYVEISSKTGENIMKVLEIAMEYLFAHHKENKEKCCLM